MKIFFLTNNPITSNLVTWLRSKDENVTVICERLNLNMIRNAKPDFIVSYNYRYIISESFIQRFQKKLINLHISYLPWNRGTHPNLWSILDNTPKGVTIHVIDKGIDTGAILVQKKVNFENETETLASSYQILHEEMQVLFKKNWSKIKYKIINPRPQNGVGSFHTIKQSNKIMKILSVTDWNITCFDLKSRYDNYRKNR
jgi:dTDP-4-amino-4,6-dideoxyglucose formyltransferase